MWLRTYVLLIRYCAVFSEDRRPFRIDGGFMLHTNSVVDSIVHILRPPKTASSYMIADKWKYVCETHTFKFEIDHQAGYLRNEPRYAMVGLAGITKKHIDYIYNLRHTTILSIIREPVSRFYSFINFYKQKYPHWNRTVDNVLNVLEQYAHEDGSIRMQHLPRSSSSFKNEWLGFISQRFWIDSAFFSTNVGVIRCYSKYRMKQTLESVVKRLTNCSINVSNITINPTRVNAAVPTFNETKRINQLYKHDLELWSKFCALRK